MNLYNQQSDTTSYTANELEIVGLLLYNAWKRAFVFHKITLKHSLFCSAKCKIINTFNLE